MTNKQYKKRVILYDYNYILDIHDMTLQEGIDHIQSVAKPFMDEDETLIFNALENDETSLNISAIRLETDEELAERLLPERERKARRETELEVEERAELKRLLDKYPESHH